MGINFVFTMALAAIKNSFFHKLARFYPYKPADSRAASHSRKAPKGELLLSKGAPQRIMNCSLKIASKGISL